MNNDNPDGDTDYEHVTLTGGTVAEGDDGLVVDFVVTWDEIEWPLRVPVKTRHRELAKKKALERVRGFADGLLARAQQQIASSAAGPRARA